MKVFVNGVGSITLSDQQHFIAQGGEGKIYGKGNVIYKIYLDPLKVISERKLQELKPLNAHGNIIVPEAMVLDIKKNSIGVTMRWVKDTLPLCKMFSNAFWKASSVTPEKVVSLVGSMRDIVHFIHDQSCLVVDGNEFNYLVDETTLIDPYLIDADSIQTPHFPATAVMPSIRDYHAFSFSEESDWFSFAIVTCTLFLGIHPYKGTHPDFAKKDTEDRMRSNMSIFNSSVAIPSTARSFDYIPKNYKDWYISLFEHGKRAPPPDISGVVVMIPVAVKVVQDTDNFEIRRIREYNETVLRHRYFDGMDIVWTQGMVCVDREEYSLLSLLGEIIFLSDKTPIFVWAVNNKLIFQPLRKINEIISPVDIEAFGGKLAVVDNSVYIICGQSIVEVRLVEMGNQVVPVIVSRRDILPLATTIFEGFFLSDVFGVPYATVPYHIGDKSNYRILRLLELKDHKIVSGKRVYNYVVIVASDQKGNLKRFIFRFDVKNGNDNYELFREDDTSYTDINFTVLNSGIGLIMNDDDSIYIFKGNKVNLLSDKKIDSDMTFTSRGSQMAFYEGKRLTSISTK